MDNNGWTKKQLANQYKKDNPQWDNNKCLEKANIIFKELNRLNTNMQNNDNNFFNHTVPFSYSPFLEEELFDDFRKTDQYKLDCQNEQNNKIIKMIVKQLDNKEEIDNE